MTDFATPNARAILIATSRHRPGGDLSDLPTVLEAIDAAEECLITRCGLTTEQINRVVDASTLEVIRRVKEAAEADGPLIIWYIGHALVTDEPAPQLYLATPETILVDGLLQHTALPYATIRSATLNHRAAPRRPTLIIIDSCFSGRATAMPARAADAGFNLSAIQGIHVITAADDDTEALVGTAGPVFTRTIVDILRDGNAAGPAFLTVNGLFQMLSQRLDRIGMPSPRQHSEDGIGTLVLAPNPAYQHPRGALPEPGEPAPGWDIGASPFPGPRPIGSIDRRLFFGRDESVRKLIDGLNEHWMRPGPHVITGPSGVGKSSLVLAGLLPWIKDGKLKAAGSAGWRQWTMTPGLTPLTAFAQACHAQQQGAKDVAALRSTLLTDPASAASLIAGPTETEPLILVVDQFEQVFARDVGQDERDAFVAALAAAADVPVERGRPEALVLLVVSADHLGRCMRYPALRVALKDLLVIDPLPLHSLHDIVTGPARVAGLGVEDGLIAVITADADAGVPLGRGGTIAAGALPHIAGALYRTWQNREAVPRGHVLTTAAYQTGGGIRDALGQSAEETFQGLTAVQRPLAQRLMLDLIGVYETADAPVETRRRVPRTELARPADPPNELDAVIHAFADERLLTRDGTEGAETVELSHEALIGAWTRLRGWIDADRDWFRLRARIDDDAAEYERNRTRDRLYRGRQLAAAEDGIARAGRSPHELSERTRRFLVASQRQRRLLRSVVAAVAVVLLALTGTSIAMSAVIGHQRDDATAKALAIEAAQLMAKDPALGRQVAVAAYRVTPNADSRTSVLASQAAPLVTRARDHLQQSFSSAASADGRVLATGGTEGAVNIWDLTNLQQPRLRAKITGTSGAVFSVAMSRDGTMVAAGDIGGNVRVWRLTGAGAPAAVPLPNLSPSGRITAVAFDSSGRRLATGSSVGRLLIVPIDGGATRPAEVQLQTAINSLAFRPGTGLLAAALGSGAVGLWKLDTGTVPQPSKGPLGGFGFAARAVTFSPDGAQLAAASAGAEVRVWTMTPNGATTSEKRLTGAQDAVYALAYSPDSATLAGATNDGRALLWQPASGSDPTETLPHPASLHGVQFATGGRSLTTTGQDGILRVWRRPGRDVNSGQGPIMAALSADGRLAATNGMGGVVRLWAIGSDGAISLAADLPKEYQSSVQKMAFSRDGKLLAAPAESGEIDLWDVSHPENPTLLTTLPDTIQAPETYVVTFSPDGTLLAAGGQTTPTPQDGLDGTLRVWNIAQPRHPVTVASHRDRSGAVLTLSFSADGHWLAAGGGNGQVNLYRANDPKIPKADALTGNASYIHAVRFAPRGSLLAVGDERGRVRIMDAAHPDLEPKIFTADNSVILDIAWLSTGRIAAADNNGTTWIWEIGSPMPWTRLATHDRAVYTVAADESGRTMITAGADGHLQVFETDPQSVLDSICREVGLPMDESEWRQIEPDTDKPTACD